jgi:hypothetical protein
MDSYLRINRKQTFYPEKTTTTKIASQQAHFSKMIKMMVFSQSLSKAQYLGQKITFLPLKKRVGK